MKNLKQLVICILVASSFYACNDGIDAITKVEPGQDASAPQITIKFPLEGTTIKVLELVASINIEFEVTDDIEIGSVSVKMDGAQIASYGEFSDYRRFLEEFTYDNVTTGDHTLTITATDIDGKSTSASVNFTKEPPYTPLFAGETFYMPFDGDYFELVSIEPATEVGSPGFAGEGRIGLNSYLAGTDNYITFPANGLLTSQFSASFWYKVSGSPDRAGILVIGDDADDRNQGFRLFREGSPTEQRIKLNVGTGSGESWNDGDVIDVTAGEWVHIAFTISDTENIIYFNGQAVRTSAMGAAVDWTGCGEITIGAGGDTFSYWNHLSDTGSMDDLRLFNKALSAAEVQEIADSAYEPQFDGETFYMPFNSSLTELNSGVDATEVGTTGFAGESVKGSDAFAGATDSYLTYPTNSLTTDEFSATFWYKVNADPDRAGILVIGPSDFDNANYPDVQNKRTNGFRFFREGNATNQTFKLNVGNGTADSWFDGGAAASLDPATAGWVHMAFTISGTEAVIYFDGEIVSQGAFTGIDWTDCDILSIMSGAPRFTEWGHLSDNSFMDELRLYNKALSQGEIQNIMNADL